MPQSFLSLEEAEGLAKSKLPKMVYDYYAGGAETEFTVRENRRAYEQWRVLPRMMVDVSNVDTSTTLLGHRLPLPLLVAPMAMMRMAHPEGEVAVARAAAKLGVPMVQSTMGTVPLASVRQAAGSSLLMFFQLYVIRDRDFTRAMVQNAERAGYQGLMVTVDAPFLGNREHDERNNFVLPDGLALSNLEGVQAQHEARGTTLEVYGAPKGSGIAAVFVSQIDSSLTWDFLAWLRTFTKMPVFVKGVLHPQDAARAVEAGAAGIVVSNHGGRQADYAPGTLDVLPAIARAVGGRVPLLMDGGVRRGTDIIKAVALGADAVLVGRPVLWGLALGGQAGVERVLGMLSRELRLSMALCGVTSMRHLSRGALLGPRERL